MAPREEDSQHVDQPEPEQVLEDRPARTRDQEPADADDRPVELTDPESTDPPVDDMHRDPEQHEPDA